MSYSSSTLRERIVEMTDTIRDNHFDFSKLNPPMEIILQLRGFENNSYAVQEEQEKHFCFQLVEQIFVPLRKQIRLDHNIDLVITIIKTEVPGQRRISFYLNTADVIYFQEKELYQVITRREGVSGNIYELMHDARYVRMYYTSEEFYDKYKRKNDRNHGASNPYKKRRVMRKMKRPSIEEINEGINISVLRFKNAINEYIEKSFGKVVVKPEIIGVFSKKIL